MIGHKSRKDILCRGLNYLLLALFVVTIALPFYYIIVLSFNEGQDTLKGSLMLWPRSFTMENYKTALTYKTIASSMWISATRTLIVTSVGLLLSSTLAYALTFRALPGRKFLTMFFYFTTLFGGGLIPTYILYRQLHILSTYWVLIIPSLYSVWNVFILRTFFSGLPEAIAESARIDGAGELTIFFKLILPMSTPVLATVALYIGVGTWNDWFTGEYFIMMKPELLPAATTLNQLLAQSNFARGGNSSGMAIMGQGAQTYQSTSSTTTESLRMAFIVIIIFPIMCVYPFLQKYFVKGALIGSVKG